MSAVNAGRDWDAATYDRVADPQLEWGAEVLARLPLRGDETVLDAGCGSGRVTALLLERLPRGRVIGVDASPSMVELARRRLGPRVDLRVGDLAEVALDRPVDAVFSNAVFHWIADHERLFRRLHATLRPGGRLAAQCGGEGNVASLGSAIREVWAAPPFTEFEPPPRSTWNFASPEATASRLLAAGFTDVDCWLEPRPVTPPEPRAFLEAVTVGPHLERLPGELRDPFLDAVLERLGEPVVLDYVRLNIAARRPG